MNPKQQISLSDLKTQITALETKSAAWPGRVNECYEEIIQIAGQMIRSTSSQKTRESMWRRYSSFAWGQRGGAKLFSGDTKGAISDLERAIGEDHVDKASEPVELIRLDNLELLTYAYAHRGNITGARDTLQGVDFDDGQFEYFDALLWLKGSNKVKAKKRLTNLLKEHPEKIPTYVVLAEIATREGNGEKAVEYARQGIEQAKEQRERLAESWLDVLPAYILAKYFPREQASNMIQGIIPKGTERKQREDIRRIKDTPFDQNPFMYILR